MIVSKVIIISNKMKQHIVQDEGIQKEPLETKKHIKLELKIELEEFFKMDTMKQLDDLFKSEKDDGAIPSNDEAGISQRTKKDRDAKDAAWQRFDEMSTKYNYFKKKRRPN